MFAGTDPDRNLATVKTPFEKIGFIDHCLSMPAKSKKQQMAAGAALSAKRAGKSKSTLKGASKSMANSMSKKKLEELAHTKRKSLPVKKR